jgi:hypothetical protein
MKLWKEKPMATNNAKPSFFARYIDKPPPPTEETIKRPQNIQHAQRILDWLQRWPEPYVRIRDFKNFGPRPRDRESVLNSAKILVENGWLNPLQPCRRDGQTWKIVRRPVVNPQVAAGNPSSQVAAAE